MGVRVFSRRLTKKKKDEIDNGDHWSSGGFVQKSGLKIDLIPLY